MDPPCQTHNYNCAKRLGLRRLRMMRRAHGQPFNFGAAIGLITTELRQEGNHALAKNGGSKGLSHKRCGAGKIGARKLKFTK